MPLDVQPVTLQGETIRLEPLCAAHAESLAAHAQPGVFRWMGLERPLAPTPEAVSAYIEALDRIADVRAFAMVLQDSGEAVGASTYMDIRRDHYGLEIGRTWIGKAYQGTKVNPEAKFLMLRHAFETLGCHRVQLKTDLRNLQSQHAIEKLGALKEGVLRKQMVMPDGFVRDTVMYSITAEEWPSVKEGLLRRLGQSAAEAARSQIGL